MGNPREMRLTDTLTIISANPACLVIDNQQRTVILNASFNAIAANFPGGVAFFNNLEDDYMVEGFNNDARED